MATVRQISTEQTYDLRSRVLRPGLPVEQSKYPADPEAVHFGAFEGEALVSIVTAHPEENARWPAAGQWRIRGMATDPAHQGRGLGGEGLRALLAWGKAKGIPLFWCNARKRAIPFYESHGFAVVSELFEIPGIGPHKVMWVQL